jgi:hypothetical protein
MASTPPAPLKRLSRPAKPPPFLMTERDVTILAAVARFRFLSSDQIVRLVGGSEHAIAVRLKLLFYHRLLDRPRHQHAQLAFFFDEGNQPLVYGLGRKGAAVLAERGVAIDAKLDWTMKNRRATATFLAHTLETAEAMLAFQSAIDAHNEVSLVDHHALRPYFPPSTQAMRDPFRLRVAVPMLGSGVPIPIAVVPDRLFSIVYDNGTRHNFALEIDRGTMDVAAKRLVGKSSYRRKIVGYFYAWREKRHTSAWGFQSFRVLTITPSEKRIATMCTVQRDVTKGAADGLFLYATPEAITRGGATGPVWTTGSGEVVRLLA